MSANKSPAGSKNLSTDASKRFERSVDSSMAEIALDLLSGLIIKYSGGEASSDIIKLDTIKEVQFIHQGINNENHISESNFENKDLYSFIDFASSLNMTSCFYWSFILIKI